MTKRVIGLLALVSAITALTLGIGIVFGLSSSLSNVGMVIVSEVAWAGTAANSTHEWIELYNNSVSPVNLSGWSLNIGENITIPLNGSIAANSFYLLERNGDYTVSDIPADKIFNGSLDNGGDVLALRDGNGTIIDTANFDSGPWPAGSSAPDYLSMERAGQVDPDTDTNWQNNDTVSRNGMDANGEPINGTPRRPNSGWDVPGSGPDLALVKSGPTEAVAGSQIQYTLSLENLGTESAYDVLLTDTLPIGFSYVSDDSGIPVAIPTAGTLLWQIGTLSATQSMSFQLSTAIGPEVLGLATNHARTSMPLSETTTINNHAQSTVSVSSPGPLVYLDALYYDGYESGDADEALRLLNVGLEPADLSGWQLTDGVSTAQFPAGSYLEPGQAIWVTKQATSFARQFGFDPNYEAGDSDPSVPKLSGTWPGFSNSGDEAIILNAESEVIDVIVYEDGDISQYGWIGVPVEPYTVPSVFGSEGQILYRMRYESTGSPVPDTNSADDWAQARTSILSGRKVRYPGWNLEEFYFTQQVTETAQLIIAIAPDNAYETLISAINAAENHIKIEALTLRSSAITSALAEVAGRGVKITVLLEGDPPTGIDAIELYNCRELEAAGAQCWFMIRDDDSHIQDRYRFLHAKFLIIDGQQVAISSENLSPDSLPNDDKSDGTWGRRGLILMTDAPGVVERVEAIWNSDFDAARHVDLFRWAAGHPIYGDPPVGTEPITVTGGTTYTVNYPEPAEFPGTFSFEVIQSPENSLRSIDGLLGLLEHAGSGDEILVEQLTERAHWGPSNSDPAEDPNPRLQAYIAAARRGAKVRILLDEYLDDASSSVSNLSTCHAVNQIALDEALNMWCALSNPTGLGIHNKMILVRLDGLGFVHVGSINGTELSSKGNRELAVQVQSNEAYELLADLFYLDWPDRMWLSAVFNEFQGPANHVLISEVLYDPAGPDDAEFIELVNPTHVAVDLSNYSLGDAVNRDDFEDVRRFPAGAVLEPNSPVVVATTATAFRDAFGFNPDYEILDSDLVVQDLIDDPLWGDPAAILQLANVGDEVILRNVDGQIVDAIAYGSGSVAGTISCQLVSTSDRSLERYPYWQDTDNCPGDFREWAFPNPGSLP